MKLTQENSLNLTARGQSTEGLNFQIRPPSATVAEEWAIANSAGLGQTGSQNDVQLTPQIVPETKVAAVTNNLMGSQVENAHMGMHAEMERKLFGQMENINQEQMHINCSSADLDQTFEQRDNLLQHLPLHFTDNRPKLLPNDLTVKEHLRRMQRYRKGEPCNYLQLMAGLQDRPKLDLWQLLSQALPEYRPGARRFYKLILSLPAGSVGDKLEHQLDRNLLKCPKDHVPDDAFFLRGLSQGIALSVVKLRGVEEWSSHLDHANGLVCFGHDGDLMEAKERLHLLAETSHCPYLAFIIERFSCTKLPLRELFKEFQLQELKLKGLNIYKYRKDGLIFSLKAAIRSLASQTPRNCEELQQVNLHKFLLSHLLLDLFQRIRLDPNLLKLCQRFPQLCQEVFNEAVHRLQMVAGEDFSMMPQMPQELAHYVETSDDTINTNLWEHFQPNWQSKESRQIIVKLMEKTKMPTIKDAPNPHQWLTDYIVLTQHEDCVASLVTESTQRLLQGDGYLDLMELWVTKRLAFILDQAEQQMALVYKISSLKAHFQRSWFYEFVQKSQFKIEFDMLLMPPPPAPPPATSLASSPASSPDSPSNSPPASPPTLLRKVLISNETPLNYQDVVYRAEKVLNRYHMRRQGKPFR